MPAMRERRHLVVSGRVQGVGFRPFAARLAGELGLAGVVGNDLRGAWIEIEGETAALDDFARRLVVEAPPLARIACVDRHDLPLAGQAGFTISASQEHGDVALEVAPDAATCPACRAEIREPSARRHRYAFTTCTDCGPRYSIITGLPYDRPRTTMAGFPLCADCAREYHDPADRRFHAQPLACPACGPRLALTDAGGLAIPGDPVEVAARLLHQGRIVAVKGVGGFHLAVRADDEAAVRRLRERKGRESKPLALLVRDLTTAQTLVDLDAEGIALLTSPAAPIVLAPRRSSSAVAPVVAPGTDLLGVMLPANPLHLLLAEAAPPLLVLTSGNPSGEPLCHEDDAARRRLATVADAFLGHDRPIARPLDDSVALAAPGSGPIILRRGRGLVPEAIRVPAGRSVLAVGGDLKAAVCLAGQGRAVLGEHLGDLEHPASFRHFVAAIDRLRDLLRLSPEVIACDPHPGYHASRHARSLGLPLIPVQHHLAHLAAVAAEHGLEPPLLGLICDGTGYGDDGTIWGGEILAWDGTACRRLGHLTPVPLMGGDRGADETWRPLLGLLHRAWGGEVCQHLQPGILPTDEEATGLLVTRLQAGRGVPCSSLGRLFDAVAGLLGVARANRHEAEAAMALEAQAMLGRPLGRPAPVVKEEGGRLLLDPLPLVLALHAEIGRGASVGDLARTFHEGVIDLLLAGLRRAAQAAGLRRVVLGGGCFASRLLLAGVQAGATDSGLEVFTPRLVPPGDGGLALGQALVAIRTAS